MPELDPLFISPPDTETPKYDAADLGLPYNDIIKEEGVVGVDDLLVTDTGGLSVNVAAGVCWVKGDSDPDAQPMYRCRNDDTVNLVITPDASQPRIVRIVAQVHDSAFSGAETSWKLTTVHGTAATHPAPPAEPPSATTLAMITVAAHASLVTAGNISDSRTPVLLGAPNVADRGKIARATIIIFAGPDAPDGWLLCDGAAVSRSTYADLFAVVGTTYGVGDGSSTFNLPDLRGRVPVGVNPSRADALSALGSDDHSHSLDLDHSHTYELLSLNGGGSPPHTNRPVPFTSYELVPWNEDAVTDGPAGAGSTVSHLYINFIIKT